VLATRLSEDTDRAVLLVEAGPDHPDVRTLPPDVVDASEPTVGHDWGYAADAELDRGIPVPRARIMGGCSATNAWPPEAIFSGEPQSALTCSKPRAGDGARVQDRRDPRQ